MHASQTRMVKASDLFVRALENAGSAVAKQGHSIELGPPDYDAELCGGWTVELAAGSEQR